MTEESTVYSQAIHYANRIVYLRVPLDVVSHRQRMNNYNERGESNSNSVTNRCGPEQQWALGFDIFLFTEAFDRIINRRIFREDEKRLVFKCYLYDKYDISMSVK